MLAKLKSLFTSGSESAKVAELEEKLAEAETTIQDLEAVLYLKDLSLKGLDVAIGLLEKRNDENTRNGMVTIGCLLSAADGQVKLSRDLIQVMDASNIHIDFKSEDDTMTLTLVPEEVTDAIFEDDGVNTEYVNDICGCDDEEALS